MKIEWLVTDVTTIGFPGREVYVILGGDFGWACCWPNQAIFVVAEPLCDVGTPS